MPPPLLQPQGNQHVQQTGTIHHIRALLDQLNYEHDLRLFQKGSELQDVQSKLNYATKRCNGLEQSLKEAEDARTAFEKRLRQERVDFTGLEDECKNLAQALASVEEALDAQKRVATRLADFVHRCENEDKEESTNIQEVLLELESKNKAMKEMREERFRLEELLNQQYQGYRAYCETQPNTEASGAHKKRRLE